MSQGGSPMTLPRSVELHWQEDVIERWLLHTPGVSADAHANLREMLRDVKNEINSLAPGTDEVHERGKARCEREIKRA
jgi:hypothetical protein